MMMGGVNSVQWRARSLSAPYPTVGCVLVAITVHAPVFLFRFLRIITFPLHCAICHLTLSRNTFLLHLQHLGYHMRTNCANHFLYVAYLTPRRLTLSSRFESKWKSYVLDQFVQIRKEINSKFILRFTCSNLNKEILQFRLNF